MYVERPSRGVPGAVAWSVSAAAAGGRVLPDGCMDLVWADGRLLVAGPDTRAHSAAPVAPGSPVLGVRLPPGAAPVLLGVPARALRDQRPDLADVWGARVARPWLDAVAEGGVAALERRIAARLAERGGRPADVAAVARLVGAGIGAAEVADRAGVTPRTLHRRCQDAFGYGPRTLARVLRLQRVLPLLDAGIPLADVAQRAGYADQPHLSREVRALTGRSPAALASDRAAG
ncbi:helix-turn-helix transcriptional regulator [Cellulomonas endometrii]|uniref:helix-turn-helix transcriptional regulator n=1 Tax=Cellulomonas endometrii TaxID=3036301 RepID=UPI0024AE6388|nr:helix-turn-helix transcriptional regulator [Cellulomonas endometrii]